MELENIKRVYLIGIGGIGMSGLARYFKKRGCVVCGYDKTITPLTSAMRNEGISVVYQDEEDNLKVSFLENDPETLIIYTPAIPKDSKILNYFRSGGFSLKKRSEVLGIISKGMYTIAVAGTHGKTTTSSIIAHVLKDSGYDCSAFLGGIATNYDSNVLFGDNNTMVVEADEFDRSFLTLYPDFAIVTSMDADHLDIYGDRSHLVESFRQFVSQIKESGRLIFKKGLDLSGGKTYSANVLADIQAVNVKVKEGSFYFDFKNENIVIENVQLGLPGLHNIENAVAAIEVALHLGIDPEKIKKALASFLGVKRRFEYILKDQRHIYIDDYAHHPEELRACIQAVKTLYPDKKLTTIFQPHLFTRTRDFAEGFSEVLSMTDELIMLDIYPARELPIEGVSSDMILDKVSIETKQILSKEQTLDYIRAQKPELLLTVGAGDIDTLIIPLKEILTNV
ncbi:UDP-N-acetylmuramate--L-alanine ligase [Daejeonella sp.]|uniref:UDP-N-acetylmuramate--L-alanine ligase n=1 Tax=Daejeonella sp. TaxID=2805397 RepID=UPI0027319041|nr:UDP-N-acetylmuramate--L-alanine ligase [Daejeonella sp.]MDP2413160.1 UDP-N-acetylmuramate--L-alanine ligase [Daejeonella sp.]